MANTKTLPAKKKAGFGAVVGQPLPAMMEAAAIDRFGPASLLTVHRLAVPKPGANQVLIEVHAAGVGIWDAQTREGTWAEGHERFPLVLGTDGAGVVVARGERVRRLSIGESVWAYQYANPKGGFYAEYVAVDADNAALKPSSTVALAAGLSSGKARGSCLGLPSAS